MTSFFNVGALGGNPFSTPVGQRIEQATDATLASENWALNMEICDMINESESSDAAKDAMKAIRKRLTQNAGKNFAVIMLTLTVLETCVKNCGKPFHVLVSQKEFIQELVKLIGPKNDPPTAVQEKVLSLIQVWADAFKNQTDLQGAVQVYQELKNKGIEFPMTDLDALAPIFTPQRSVPETISPPASLPTQPISPTHAAGTLVIGPQAVQATNGPPTLTPDQVTKLTAHLEIVSLNMSVLGEMLSELKPGQENPEDYKLLNDLTETCKEMQGRIVELIGRVNHDELTAELLRINDELNNLFLRHQRYEKNRDPNTTNAPSAILGAAIGIPPPNYGKVQGKDSLIDLSDAEAAGGADVLPAQFKGLEIGTASSQLAKIEVVSAISGATTKVGGDVDEFDILAQSRKASVEDGTKSKANFKDIPIPSIDNALPALKSHDPHTTYETEFDEMAAWLDHSKDDGPEESLTSTEFDKFLAERAAAAENLPIVTGTTGSGSGGDAPGNRSNVDVVPTSNRPKKNRSKKDDDSLLAI